MYVIFPAEEVVYCSYGTHSPLLVPPRPTLDNLSSPQVPLNLAPRRAHAPDTTDIFAYEAGRGGRSATPRPHSEPSAPPAKEKKHRFLRLKKSQDPEFGKTLRSPNVFNYDLPVPLPTPAFSKKNIFERDFDALFQVSSTPEFTEHIRVVTPECSRAIDATPEQLLAAEDAALEDEEYLNEPEIEESPGLLRVPEPDSAPPTPRSLRRPSPASSAVLKSSSLEGFYDINEFGF